MSLVVEFITIMLLPRSASKIVEVNCKAIEFKIVRTMTKEYPICEPVRMVWKDVPDECLRAGICTTYHGELNIVLEIVLDELFVQEDRDG